MKKIIWNLVAMAFVALMLCCGNVLLAVASLFGCLYSLQMAGVMNVWEELNEE